MSDAGWTQCAGTTQRGTRCRHMVWKHYGFTMCTMHRHQEPELMVTEPIAEKDAPRNSWFREEYERAKARNALIPPHARMVVTNPILSAHTRKSAPARVTSPDGRAAQDHGSSA